MKAQVGAIWARRVRLVCSCLKKGVIPSVQMGQLRHLKVLRYVLTLRMILVLMISHTWFSFRCLIKDSTTINVPQLVCLEHISN